MHFLFKRNLPQTLESSTNSKTRERNALVLLNICKILFIFVRRLKKKLL